MPWRDIIELVALLLIAYGAIATWGIGPAALLVGAILLAVSLWGRRLSGVDE